MQAYVVPQRLVFNAPEEVRDTMPQTTLTLATRGPGLYEFTDTARAFVDAAAVDEGLLTVGLASGLGRSRMR